MIHMHDDELDLIAELAAGELDPDTTDRAEELVARGGEYQMEYEAQVAALSALADASSVELTDIERARIRRGVMAEIGQVAAPRTIEPAGLRWLRPLAAAAAAVVVVGFGAWFLSPRSGDTAAESAGDQPVLSTEGADTAGAASGSVAQDDQFGPNSDTARTPADHAGAEERLTAVSAEPFDLGSVSSRDIDDEYLTGLYLGVAQYTVDEAVDTDTVLLTCARAAADLSDQPLLAFGTATYDGVPAQYFGFVDRRLVFLDDADCSLLGEHP